MVCQVVKVALLGLIFWRQTRGRRPTRSTTAERTWSVWVGYLITCALIAALGWSIFPREQMYGMTEYPFFAVTTGLVFFVLGSSYWGGCYGFAAAFFALSWLMLMDCRWAALEFGLLWAVALVILGARLRSLAGQSPAEPPAADGR